MTRHNRLTAKASEPDRDLALLHHTLGISDPYRPERAPYRNHFVAGEGHADMDGLQRLVQAGLMSVSQRALCSQGQLVFAATEQGRELALSTRPRASRSKLRYARFLEARDCCEDLTFREFLQDPQYAASQ